DLEKKKTEVIEAIAELNRAKQAMEHYRDRLNAIQQRNNVLDGELKEKASLLEVEVQEIQNIKNYIANKTAQKGAIQTNQEDLQERVTSLQQKLEDLDSEVDSAKETLTQVRSTIKNLQEFKKQFEGYESGVRELMLREGSSGKYTLLTDLFEVERGFEKALEAACAQRLQEIIVDSPEEALEAIRFLRDGNKGRGSFLPKIWYTTSPSSQPVSGLQTLNSRVRLLDEKLKGIIEAMLRNIYIIDSLENAFSYRQKLPSGTILVTREGDLFNVDGVIAGGSEDSFAHQVVTKQGELQGLQEEERKQESQYLETTKRLDDVQRELQEAEEQLENLYHETHQVEIDLVDFKGKLDQRERHQQQLQTRLNEIDAEIKQLTEEGDRINMSLAEARIRMTDSESIRQAGEKGIEEYQRDLAKLKEDVIQQAYLVTDLKVTVASLSERRTHLNSELAKSGDVCKEIESKMSQHQMEVGDSDKKRVELSQEIETTKQQLLNFIKDHEEAKRQLSTARSRFEEAMAELRKFEEGSKDIRATYEEAVEKVNHSSLRLQELRMEIQRLEEQMQDRYFINLHQIYEGYKLEEVNQQDADQELEILKNRLHRMGEVNTSAIEEYDEVQKRHQFLLTQRDDLSESVDRLKKTIEKINRVSRQRFEAAFHAVNDKFQKVFPILFGGGKAELILTEPENLLESGVEIFAKPPGKKLQNINLLSGGEKALTAVSLIFSIFLIKPSPFCLLDEVDAPLDDANIGRFNEMVGQMANMSQFILITHNKRTMEIADVLYGVTMEQPGVSKLVSVVLSDAHRMVQHEARA
ncbi:MAG TPA: chromosome segregation protein SMC, partial [Bdellovibrionota bacterium]|nr:chromosome segregation protein SMC [Bdellovibrionota bacterium]